MDTFDFQRFSSISPFAAITTIFVLLLGIVYYVLKERGLPSGPRGLPYIGYWPYLDNNATHIQLQNLMKQYGDVYSFKVMGQLYIHLGTLKAIKEASLAKADCFEIKCSDYSLLTLVFDKGIACLSGDPWRVQRKFFVQAFREFGITTVKDYMTGPIYDSVLSTVENLKAEGGKPVNIVSILNFRCSAILRRTMFNDGGITEGELNELTDAYGKILSVFNGRNTLLVGEFARRFIFSMDPKYKLAVENRKIMTSILQKVVKQHEATYDKHNIRDLIDRYIQERDEKRNKKDPTYEYFTDTALISTLVQLVGDGILGMAVFICYFIHALLEYPDEQQKIFDELEEVVGPDRQPTLDDKSKLPYTNAFMQEVNRTTDFLTLFPDLMCTKETTLSGYKIPKGAITLLNMWASHRDPKTFDDPDEFKPSRYITDPGRPKPEQSIVFGIGKRACAGESFTMMQVFLFLTTIIKNFHLTRPEGPIKKSFLDGKMEVCAHPRK